MCYPWNYPKPVNRELPLCQYFGNDCFFKKFQDNAYKLENCDCLPACNEINYKFVVDFNRKFSKEEINHLCANGTAHHRNILQSEKQYMEHLKLINITFNPHEHATKVCKKYIKTQFARVQVKIDGSSYLRRIQSLKYKVSDKFAVIGGTLGLFTGFSFIVFFELLYWILVTIHKNMSGSKTEEKDPLKEELSSIKSQVLSELKEMILDLNKRSLDSGSVMKIGASCMTNQLTEPQKIELSPKLSPELVLKTGFPVDPPFEVPSPSHYEVRRLRRRHSIVTISHYSYQQQFNETQKVENSQKLFLKTKIPVLISKSRPNSQTDQMSNVHI